MSANDRRSRQNGLYNLPLVQERRMVSVAQLEARIIAGIRGDDQDRAVGMISAEYAEQVVREEFSDYRESLNSEASDV